MRQFVVPAQMIMSFINCREDMISRPAVFQCWKEAPRRSAAPTFTLMPVLIPVDGTNSPDR